MKKTLLTFVRMMLFAVIAAISSGVGCDTTPTVTSPTLQMPSTLRGTNLAGGEWVWNPAIKPVEGTHFKFVSHQDIDYLTSKGFTFGRLLFSWEILQPNLAGELDKTYLATLVDRVEYATSKGMFVMIEPHGATSQNFVRYKGNLVGTTQVPNSAFSDLWVRLANQFKSNSKVAFGLSNEPNSMGTMQWFMAAQNAISSIRATGATNIIMIGGNGWSQPGSWNDTWYDTSATKVSNATGWATLSDPLKRIVVSVHAYFDANGSGQGDDIANPDILAQRLQPVVTWARAKGLKVHLSEFGANKSTPGAQTAVQNALKYIDANSDVVMGWAWWAYGPPDWWGSYHFTLSPTNNYTVDDAKLSWLKPYFREMYPQDASTPVPVPTSSPTKPTAPILFTKGSVFTTVSSATTSWAYVPTSYDVTHETPMPLFVWLHGCGGRAQYDVSMVSPGGSQSWLSLAVGGREGTCWSSLANDGAKVLAAIADMKTHFNVDTKRVYLGGYSSGGDIGYELAFSNANLFAGLLFENTGPSATALTLAKTASWKLNIAQLSHVSDTTYPIASIRTKMATLTALGFNVSLIEKPGSHWDNDTATSGTAYDLRTYLLPKLTLGWSTPSPDAGVVVDASVLDSGVDASQLDASAKDASVDASVDASAPSLLPLVVSSTKTSDWGSGYCRQYYFENKNAVSRKWVTMTIYLKDSRLRGTSAVWGAIFPSPTATGTIVVKPETWTAVIPAKTKVKTVGYCADYGPLKYAGVSGGLTY